MQSKKCRGLLKKPPAPLKTDMVVLLEKYPQAPSKPLNTDFLHPIAVALSDFCLSMWKCQSKYARHGDMEKFLFNYENTLKVELVFNNLFKTIPACGFNWNHIDTN